MKDRHLFGAGAAACAVCCAAPLLNMAPTGPSGVCAAPGGDHHPNPECCQRPGRGECQG